MAEESGKSVPVVWAEMIIMTAIFFLGLLANIMMSRGFQFNKDVKQDAHGFSELG